MKDAFSVLISEEITNKDIISFLDGIEVVQIAFKKKGWIAGGFPREIHHFQTMLKSDKYNKEDFEQYFDDYFDRGGDIDIFFKDKDTVDQVEKDIPVNHPIYSGNHTFALSVDHFRQKRMFDIIRIQLVNKFFHKSVEDTFRSFDFYNSCYAIQKIGKTYFLSWQPDAPILDQQKILRINHTQSPYTIQRIVKYIKRKRLDKIDDHSLHQLTDLIYRLAVGSFESKYRFNQLEDRIYSHLKFVFEKCGADPTDAILFLGKWKTEVEDETGPKYARTLTVDWATKVLQECVSDS